MSEKPESKARRSWISEGLIVAATPVVAYLLAFLYESGFASVFHIPVEFITVNLASVFIAAGALLITALTLLSLWTFLYLLFEGASGPVHRGLVRVFPCFLLFAGYLLIFGPMWREWVPLACVLAFLALLTFGWPLITQRGKGTYRQKLAAQEVIEAGTGVALGQTVRRVGRASVTVIYYLMLAGFLSHAAGRARALKEAEFLVPSSSPGSVVLRVYPDKVVCAPFDRATKRVQQRFLLLRPTEEPGLVLRLEKVGPLRMEEH